MEVQVAPPPPNSTQFLLSCQGFLLDRITVRGGSNDPLDQRSRKGLGTGLKINLKGVEGTGELGEEFYFWAPVYTVYNIYQIFYTYYFYLGASIAGWPS